MMLLLLLLLLLLQYPSQNALQVNAKTLQMKRTIQKFTGFLGAKI